MKDYISLEEFVKSTLIGIKNGVVNANNSEDGPGLFTITAQGDNHLEFDVAVTVEKKEGASGDAKVSVFSIGRLGASATTAAKDTVVSRVKFKVSCATIQ